jgi:hypothetical protein
LNPASLETNPHAIGNDNLGIGPTDWALHVRSKGLYSDEGKPNAFEDEECAEVERRLIIVVGFDSVGMKALKGDLILGSHSTAETVEKLVGEAQLIVVIEDAVFAKIRTDSLPRLRAHSAVYGLYASSNRIE